MKGATYADGVGSAIAGFFGAFEQHRFHVGRVGDEFVVLGFGGVVQREFEPGLEAT